MVELFLKLKLPQTMVLMNAVFLGILVISEIIWIFLDQKMAALTLLSLIEKLVAIDLKKFISRSLQIQRF